MHTFRNLRFTDRFFEAFVGRRFSASERAAIMKALVALDMGAPTRGVHIHPLRGRLEGIWAASASRSLRVTFSRDPDGFIRVEDCTRHYDD